MGDEVSAANIAAKHFQKLGTDLRGANSTDKQIVYYIQTGVLASENTDPHAITIKFRAPINTASAEDAAMEINYEGFKTEFEFKLLKDKDFERYA